MTIYRQTGERFRTELKKRGLRSANAVSHIIEHFLLMEDEAKDRIFRGEYQ